VRLLLSSILIAFALVSAAAGCQACLDEGSQGKEQQPAPTSSTRPVAEGPAKMRPKLVAPNVQFLTRDAGDDE
jgi:hypothetical protein